MGSFGRSGRRLDRGRRSTKRLPDSEARDTSELQGIRTVQRHSFVPAGNGRRILAVRQTDLPERGSVTRPGQNDGHRLGKNRFRYVFRAHRSRRSPWTVHSLV